MEYSDAASKSDPESSAGKSCESNSGSELSLPLSSPYGMKYYLELWKCLVTAGYVAFQHFPQFEDSNCSNAEVLISSFSICVIRAQASVASSWNRSVGDCINNM